MPSILIIEDDITFSLMLKTWLGKKGFEVSTVSSVLEAKKRIGEAGYDLILSDLRLPDGDGIDLLKWMKENRPFGTFDYDDQLRGDSDGCTGNQGGSGRIILPNR